MTQTLNLRSSIMDKQAKIQCQNMANVKIKNFVICPTRQRPHRFKEMLGSFSKNSVISKLIMCVDSDDPTLSQYKDISKNSSIYLIETQGMTLTEIINNAFYQILPINPDFVSVTNDDFIYRTESWDLKLISRIVSSGKPGIAYGNDLCAGINMPTTSVISAQIPIALGWLQLPTLTHLFGDNVVSTIGRKLNILHYCQNVIIEHNHYFRDRSLEDDIYRKTNSKEMYKKDLKAFMDWVENNMKNDLESIRKVVDGFSQTHNKEDESKRKELPNVWETVL